MCVMCNFRPSNSSVLKGAQMLLTCAYIQISDPLHRPLIMKWVTSMVQCRVVKVSCPEHEQQ